MHYTSVTWFDVILNITIISWDSLGHDFGPRKWGPKLQTPRGYVFTIHAYIPAESLHAYRRNSSKIYRRLASGALLISAVKIVLLLIVPELLLRTQEKCRSLYLLARQCLQPGGIVQVYG